MLENLLQIGVDLLQIRVAFVITNRGNSYCKLGQLILLQIGEILLQIGAGTTNRVRFITNRGRYYKLW